MSTIRSFFSYFCCCCSNETTQRVESSKPMSQATTRYPDSPLSAEGTEPPPLDNEPIEEQEEFPSQERSLFKASESSSEKLITMFHTTIENNDFSLSPQDSLDLSSTRKYSQSTEEEMYQFRIRNFIRQSVQSVDSYRISNTDSSLKGSRRLTMQMGNFQRRASVPMNFSSKTESNIRRVSVGAFSDK